jgi:pantetheine-phosphate adenylyltransferase
MKEDIMQRIVYPGTFDPITDGHVNIAYRAAQLFDEVVTAIAQGSHKNTLLPLNDRSCWLKKSLNITKTLRLNHLMGY